MRHNIDVAFEESKAKAKAKNMAARQHNAHDGGDAHSKPPMFSKLYDKMFPPSNGTYTFEQDMRHSAVMFTLMFAMISIAIGSIGYMVYDTYHYMEDSVLVPSTLFTSDKAATVESELSSEGFRNVSYDESVGVTATGTSKMCSEYKSSFRSKHVLSVLNDMDETSYIQYGILSMSLNDNEDELTITTITSSPSASVIGYMTTNNGVQDVIDGLAQWCAVNHNGQKLKVVFVHDGDTYLEQDIESTSELVSILEGDENSSGSSDSASSDGSGDSDSSDADASSDDASN